MSERVKYYSTSKDIFSVRVSGKQKFIVVGHNKKGQRFRMPFATVMGAKNSRVVHHSMLDGYRMYIYKLYSDKPKAGTSTLLREIPLSMARRQGGVCEKCELYSQSADRLATAKEFPSQVKLTPALADCKQCVQTYQNQYDRLKQDCANHPARTCLNSYGIKDKLMRYLQSQILINQQWPRMPVVVSSDVPKNRQSISSLPPPPTRRLI